MGIEADKRPGLHILKHVDIGYNRPVSKAAIAVETNAGPAVLILTPDMLAEHVRLCGELLDMIDDATLDRKPHSSPR